jgi:hypothetical protein
MLLSEHPFIYSKKISLLFLHEGSRNWRWSRKRGGGLYRCSHGRSEIWWSESDEYSSMCRAQGQGDLFVSLVRAATLPWTNKLRALNVWTAYEVLTLYTLCMCGINAEKYIYVVWWYCGYALLWWKICEYYYILLGVLMCPGFMHFHCVLLTNTKCVDNHRVLVRCAWSSVFTTSWWVQNQTEVIS